MIAFWEIGSLLGLIVLTAPILGGQLARLFTEGEKLPTWTVPFQPLEKAVRLWLGPSALAPMDWRTYSRAVLAFSVVSLVAVLAIELTQAHLPFNPQGLPNVPFWLALNTATPAES